MLLAAAGGAGCHYKVMPYGAIDGDAAGDVLEAVVRIRGLPPRRPVKFRAMRLAAARAEVRESFEQQLRSGSIARQQRVWVRLGLLDAKDDLRATYQRLYADAPIGYYDSDTGEMRLTARDVLRSEVSEVIAALRRRDFLLGEALAHELTHAMVDQHHGLAAFERGVRGDDARLARRAVVEGDASKVGFTYGSLIFSDFETYLRHVERRLPAVNADDPTPFTMRERFQFPYVAGALFVEKVYRAGGWPAVDRAYLDPPRSTEQVLHPEKYLAPARDEPVALPDLPPEAWNVLGAAGKLRRLHDDALGEHGIGLLLARLSRDPAAALAAARGWAGDRAMVIAAGDRTLLVWRTQWDDEPAAARFFHTLVAAHGMTGTGEVLSRGEADGVRTIRRRATAVDLQAGLTRDETAQMLSLL